MALRLTAAMLLVGGVVLAVVAVGVLLIASDTFMALMVAAGADASHAHEMFDSSVGTVFIIAALLAGIAGAALALLLARRITRPIRSAAAVATSIAGGDLTKRVDVSGPPEMRALSAALNEMADALAEQEQVRREFVMNASHELRTPLTNLQGYLEAFRDGVMSPTPELMESLGEEVDRLRRLAASLDVLAGADDDRPVPTSLDLGAVVMAAVDLAAPAFGRRSITVTTSLANDVIVVARHDDVAQVMANLLENAARYTPHGGQVEVEMSRANDGAIVRVTNSGDEIPEAELRRVWERFYRVEKSRDRASGGAGIGLAIVRRLIEDAGGNVGAASDGGRTTFWFSLPGGLA
jgi:two-component system, OmpR family, sensor histidine kinase BaeS